MTILALDLGNNLGWALLDAETEALFDAGLVNAAKLGNDSPSRARAAMKLVREWFGTEELKGVSRHAWECLPDVIVYEDSFVIAGKWTGAKSITQWGQAVVSEFAPDVRCIALKATAVKAAATGRGNAHKETVVLAMRQQVCNAGPLLDAVCRTKREHIADAIAIGLCAARLLRTEERVRASTQ